MKKKAMTVFGATLVAAAFTFGGVDFSNTSSLEELRSHAGDYCTQADNSDCKSSSTGNIYPGYKAADYQLEEAL
jgi:hypothetical protein